MTASRRPPTSSRSFGQLDLRPFLELPPELRTETFFLANEAINGYVARWAGAILARLKEESWTVVPQRMECVERLGAFSALLDDGEALSLASLRERAIAELPGLVPTIDIVDHAAAGYEDFLTGRRRGDEVLFEASAPRLWERYFSNENLLYGATNRLAAHAAALALAPRSGAPLRILEVGAGCGSAAEALLEKLGPDVQRYTATDISPGFLRKASERLEPFRRDVGIELRLLDLDRAFETWKVGAGGYDLVLAVNVLHAVKSLDRTLAGIRTALRPGGCLVLGECVRPARGRPVHPEFVFQLLDGFRSSELDPVARPEAGFLDPESWLRSLERARFAVARVLPRFPEAVVAYPNHSIAAIVARTELDP